MMSRSAQLLELTEPSWSWDATLEEKMANLLLGPGTLHDFTFRLSPNADRDWVSVHKVIVATGSPIFYRIIKEAGNADYVDESALPSVGVQEFIRLIEFIYTGRLDFQKLSNLTELKKLHEAAVKYGMRNLQHLCKGGIDMLICLEKNISLPSVVPEQVDLDLPSSSGSTPGTSPMISDHLEKKLSLHADEMITRINAAAAFAITPAINQETEILPKIQEEVGRLKNALKKELLERVKDEFLSLANDMTQEFASLAGKLKTEVSDEIRDEIESGLIGSPPPLAQAREQRNDNGSISASSIFGPVGSGCRVPVPDTSDTYSWTSEECGQVGRLRQNQQRSSGGIRDPGHSQRQRPSRATSTPYPGTLTDQQGQCQPQSRPSNGDFALDFGGGGIHQRLQMSSLFDPFLTPSEARAQSIIQTNNRLQELQQLPIWGMFSNKRYGPLF